MNIRNFYATDANDISALFRDVYADRYVYPELYIPAMITRRNTQRIWCSAVAIKNNKIIGHAALKRDASVNTNAELAMIVTHPAARHRGVAFQLGMYLYEEARRQKLTTLTIKMVCSHLGSQLLAKNLGFHTTALLRDYVDSPFESGSFESVVVGVKTLQPKPVPTPSSMRTQPNTLALLSAPFGNKPQFAMPNLHIFPIEVCDSGERINVTLHQITGGVINELAYLPYERRIYIQVPINAMLAKYLPFFYQVGYRDAGLILDSHGEWVWLFQRGFKPQHLQLCCPTAQKLQEAAMC
ncbi:GNAT family N-acetyltransferase [Providencia alcalifaciens]|uniref:GNAT family N-acetyltransferase n=1 Tax=Providencia alcalifaciens TaxID=126385 RepID=UPI002B0558DF|nr:GNAT family N-acetyltransferase [Providencia alcalifaciens]